MRDEDRIDAALADAPRDQLRVLTAEIDDEDGTLVRTRRVELYDARLSGDSSAPPS
jgi:hypothetical protein